MGRKKRKRKKANKKEKLETMSQGAGVYSALRPHEQEARQRILQQQMSMMQPINDALGEMYGSGATMGSGGLGSIVSPEMLRVGLTSQDPNSEFRTLEEKTRAYEEQMKGKTQGSGGGPQPPQPHARRNSARSDGSGMLRPAPGAGKASGRKRKKT